MKKKYASIFIALALLFPSFVPLTVSADITADVVSCWSMDESSTGVAPVTRNDSKGTNHLTDNNTTASAAGKISNGADLEKNNSEYLSITDATQAGLETTPNFSIQGWLKLESLPSDQDYYIAVKANASGNTSYYFTIRDSGGTKTLRYLQRDADLALTVKNATVALSTGVLYDIALTVSGNTVTFYLNNNDVGGSYEFQNASSIRNTNAPFTIGSYGDGTDSFDGVLDEFVYYSRAIDATDVSTLYNSGNGVACSSIVGGGAVAAPPSEQGIINFD